MEIKNEIEKLKKDITAYCREEVPFQADEEIGFDAILDFDNWNNMGYLPTIKYRSKALNSVHILHELIHIKKFFIEGYSIIAFYGEIQGDSYYNKRRSEAIELMNKFKNIPEDYVAHKTIKEEFGFEPIKKTWFEMRIDEIKTAFNNPLFMSDIDLAVILVEYSLFAEVTMHGSKYGKTGDNFLDKAKNKRKDAYKIASSVLSLLRGIDYKDMISYNKTLPLVIDMFIPDGEEFANDYRKIIHTSLLRKDRNNKWEYQKVPL